MTYSTSQKFFAELLGTFCLVLFGCGAAVISGTGVPEGPSGLGLLGISFAFGLSVVVMAYAIGPITGCHINPAITIAMLTAGKIDTKNALAYIVAQLIGAVLASGVLYLVVSGKADFAGLNEYALGANGWGENYLGKYSTGAAFITEAVLTFVFLMVIFGTTSKDAAPGWAGLAIGLTLVLIHLFAIPVTGTSVNPARSFGPAIFAGGAALQQLWLFIVAPIAGGVVAAIVSKGLFAK